jgi:hypothetical protein
MSDDEDYDDQMQDYEARMNDYNIQLEEYEKKLHERNQTIFQNERLEWSALDQTSARMDARFDKTIFTAAAGSFGVSFAFIDKVVAVSTSAYPGLLMASWACFAVCIIVMALGSLLSADGHRKARDSVAKNMRLQFDGKPAEAAAPSKDFVPFCNYLSLFLYSVGIACLLLFVAANTLQ